MGGAYGHLMHLHEDRQLAFGDLRDALSRAAHGRLERCTEKTDGMNLVFTWDESTASAKVARSASDIKTGGMDAAALAARFVGRPKNVVTSLTEAAAALSAALSSPAISAAERTAAFSGGRDWYSLEVIDPASPNVIKYDSRRLVFHPHGSFNVDPETGQTTRRPDARGIDPLSAALSDRRFNGWLICGPQAAGISCEDTGALVVAQSAIDSELRMCGLNEASTVGDYALLNARRIASQLRLSSKASEAVARRIAQVPGAPTLPQIKKLISPSTYEAVRALVRASDPAALTAPLEHIIYRFSLVALCDVRSSMVHDHQHEVRRLRGEVDAAVVAIQSRGNDAAKRLLQAQLRKLGGSNAISSSAEGIVFRQNCRPYKLTGSFAPVNQILGLFRYGRGEARVAEAG